MKDLTHADYRQAIEKAAMSAHGNGEKYASVFGIPRGGYYPASIVAAKLGVPHIVDPAEIQAGETLLVDDLVDSGKTRDEWKAKTKCDFLAVYVAKPEDADFFGEIKPAHEWLVFPDEGGSGIEENAKRILQYIGEDVTREGLLETPKRMRRAWDEIFAGYKTDPHDLIKTFVQGTCKEMVILKNAEFYSTCVVGSTLIETPNGRKSISKLKDGEWVYTFDEKADKFTVKKCVAPRLIKKDAELVEVYTEKDTLYCTPDHKILTFKGWKEAKDLKPGDRIVSLERGCINAAAVNHKVIAVKKCEWREDVWCMDIPDTHNFVAQGMVIHNCEHHFFPFFGHCSIGYLPNKKVIGVSKLARLLDCYSRRMQIQERMTTQIADFLEQELEALGVFVVCEGVHFCMTSRGVRKQDASMVTSAIRGMFKENAALRAEFLSLIGR